MKIDISRIENYESMSAEEKLEALENYEIDYTGYVKKEAFDKASSDLASMKKKYKEQLSAEDKAKEEQTEAFNRMKEELEALRQEKQLSDMTSQYLSLGYDDSLAKDTAKAMLEGDMAKVFANQKAYQEGIEKKVKAEILKGTAKPEVHNGEKVMTKDSLRKMSPAERLKFAQENPEQYKALYENK